ncbi:transcriptional regulator [Saccharobesus litoralis]|uniref:Transcriptional regulator n=1 Tax=Saccharobesus litoralis TaxID=2172099 RepID=A0A2S0VUF0_9ALTE|nr:transcriptional regulator GcvA [Saccharobesus litoralis]AWB67813.1 transcriptional regulator [Saccharobesus litoralis]
MKRLPPLNSLRAFEAAARHLSFTKAAEELFVTQAAVSHQIKALEEFLGIKLFMRKNRALLLTEEGQSYHVDIKAVFESLYESTERLLAKGDKGAITVSLPASFAIQWLVPRLNLFSTQHPDIDVRIKAVDMDEGLLTDDVDVAIYFGRGNWPGLESTKLHTEYLTPVCSPNLLTLDKPLNRPQDLEHHNLLHDSNRKYWKLWCRKFDLKNINVNHGPIFSHSTMVIQAAVFGQGVALGHSVLARPELEAGRLIQPFQEVLITKNSYYLVCRSSQRDMGKIAVFRNWMLTLVKQEQEELLNEQDIIEIDV